MRVARENYLDSVESWIIATLGSVLLTLVWGMIFTFTVYAGALEGAFGLAPYPTTSVFSVTTGAFFVAGGAMGVVISRLPLRPVVAAVGVGLGAGVGLLQAVTSYWGVVLAFGAIGTAGGTGFVIVTSLVPQWFDVYEGRAMGLAMVGNGLGVLLLPFVWLWLFERTDVRGAFAVVGGLTAGAFLVASLVYRRPPGSAPAAAASIDVDWLRSNLADRQFVLAIVGFSLIWGWYHVLSAGLVDILATSGIARSVAATAFGVLGGISVLTRVVSGALADRLGLRPTLTGSVALAGLAVLALLRTDTHAEMYIVLVAFGFGLGAVATLYSPILIDAFGRENAVAVVGIFTIAEAPSAFLMPIVVDSLAPATGGYTVPLTLVGAATLAGAAMFHWGTAGATGRP